VESERLGLEFRNYDNLAAVAELQAGGKSDSSIGVAGHIDVVPAGRGWRYPAFGGTVAEGLIWGRGAQDDKGPIAAVYAALDVLTSLELTPTKNIRLLLGTLEETDDWPDVDLLIEKGEIPDQTFVPDGIFPVVYAEKGMAMLEWLARWEPPAAAAEPEFVSLEAGRRHNMVPANATVLLRVDDRHRGALGRRLADAAAKLEETVRDLRLSVEHRDDAEASGKVLFEIKFRGRSAHGAFPEKGHNAALDAAAFLNLIDCGGADLLHFARSVTDRCSLLDGSGFNLARQNEDLGNTTVNLGRLELDKDSGRAIVNIRYTTELLSADVVKEFSEAAETVSAGGENLTVRSRIHGRVHEALYISLEGHRDFLQSLQAAYRTVTGRVPTLRAIRGTTYAKAFPNAAAFGPLDEAAGDVEMAHEVNERIRVQRYLENIRIYALALALLAYGDRS
jgi:succinyl-diaminopimelate desuccinylase